MHTIGRALFGIGSVVLAQVTSVTVASAAKPKVEGADVVGNVGYGVGSDNYSEDADPLGFMLGVDAGYTFRLGLRLGVNYTHGFGRKVDGTRTVAGIEYPVHTHHRSDMLGGSVGYDLLLDPIRLRGSLDVGLIFFNGPDDVADLAGVTYLLAPGLAALWQLDPLELGAGVKYYGFLGEGGGLGFAGSLIAGARFF